MHMGVVSNINAWGGVSHSVLIIVISIIAEVMVLLIAGTSRESHFKSNE